MKSQRSSWRRISPRNGSSNSVTVPRRRRCTRKPVRVVDARGAAVRSLVFVVMHVEQPVATGAMCRDPVQHAPRLGRCVIATDVKEQNPAIVVEVVGEMPAQKWRLARRHKGTELGPQLLISCVGKCISLVIIVRRQGVHSVGLHRPQNAPTVSVKHLIRAYGVTRAERYRFARPAITRQWFQ